MKMERNDLKYWLALKSVEGLGNVGFKNLLSVFGSPQKVLEASVDALKTAAGIRDKTAVRIRRFDRWGQVEKEMDLARKTGVSIVTAEDPLYPQLLLNIHDYPPLLYVKGQLREDDVNVAVVGSRAASAYGRFTTERLCRDLAFAGITVVSGMARGIDSAAHRGTLSAKGRTIAVLGCGLDIVYPPENRRLFEEIAANGAVLSEFSFQTPPDAPNFPMRNRIISGMSLGVVIVEATEKSGSLITAGLALDQGREVFAVPGTIDSSGSRGTHRLIKEGAKLVERVDDILEEIRLPTTMPERRPARRPPAAPAPRKQPLDEREAAVLGHITERAVGVDDLVGKTGFRVTDVLTILLSLELSGHVEQQPGKMFVLKET